MDKYADVSSLQNIIVNNFFVENYMNQNKPTSNYVCGNIISFLPL